MVNKKLKKRFKKNKLLRYGLPLAAIVVLAVVGYLIYNHYHKKAPAVPTTSTGIKLSPPTPQEQAQANQNKSNIVNQQSQQTPQTAGSKKQVTVIITSASASRVSAYVSGIFENGGTCTATFSQNGNTITGTSTGFENVSYTQCPPITPNLPNQSPWSVVVSYSSATAEGTSAALSF